MADKKAAPPPTYLPGSEIGSKYGESGSLGCFARLVNGNGIVLLSSAHVLFGDATAWTGLDIYAPPGSSCCRGPIIARTPGTLTWSMGFNNVSVDSRIAGSDKRETQRGSETDCTIATLAPNIKFSNDIPGLGMITGIAGMLAMKSAFFPAFDKGTTSPPANATPPGPPSLVRFWSRMAKIVKYGVLVSQDFNANYTGGAQIPPWVFPKSGKNVGPGDQEDLINQFLVLPVVPPGSEAADPGSLIWCHPGDSGSIVVNAANKVVGMVTASQSYVAEIDDPPWLKAISNGTDQLSSGTGLVTPIASVLKRLKDAGFEISIDSSMDATTKAAGRTFAMPSEQQEHAFICGRDRVVAAMRASRFGCVILAKLSQHGREARQLIARNRHAQRAWHQHQGAAFVQHFLRNLRDPRHHVPDQINGVTRAQALIAMANVLGEGSLPLRRDIERYRDIVLCHAPRLDTLERVGDVIADAWREWTAP